MVYTTIRFLEIFVRFNWQFGDFLFLWNDLFLFLIISFVKWYFYLWIFIKIFWMIEIDGIIFLSIFIIIIYILLYYFLIFTIINSFWNLINFLWFWNFLIMFLLILIFQPYVLWRTKKLFLNLILILCFWKCIALLETLCT